MIKLVLLTAMVALASAATYSSFPTYKRPVIAPVYRPTPQPFTHETYNQYPVIAILRSDSDISPDGNHYQYSYETANGISAHEQGDLVGNGPDSAIAAQGSFQFTSPEGVPVKVDYVADHNGFQPVGNVLPTPHPIPEAILRSIQFNEAHPEPPTVPQRKYY